MITRVKGSTFRTAENEFYASIVDYGARSDGVTDCTAAITAALATGLPVFIPPGTYLTGGINLPASRTIFGVGKDSILKLKTAANAVVLTIASDCLVYGFQIDGNKTNQVGANLHGIQAIGAINARIREMTVANTKGDSYNVTGANSLGCNIHDCVATGFTQNGYKIEQSASASINNSVARDSDPIAAPGDGISISSNGNAVNQISLIGVVARTCVGRGFALIGNGSKNVTDVTMSACRASRNTSHGLHAINVDRTNVDGLIVNQNGGDGIRLEGDVQHVRLIGFMTNLNTGFGAREVVAGSTPNLNGFIYGVNTNNVASNTTTIVGGGSFVV